MTRENWDKSPPGGTSYIHIDFGKSLVRKKLHSFETYGILAREVSWLEKAAEIPDSRAPILLSHDDKTIVTAYAGELVSRANLPEDWREQAELILEFLSALGCAHNDIKPLDLVVSDAGRITLLDYQWATPSGEPFPEDWPTGIGGEFKSPGPHRDDRYSLIASLESFHVEQ